MELSFTVEYDGTSKPTKKRLVFALQYMSAGFNPFERIIHQRIVFSKNALTKL